MKKEQGNKAMRICSQKVREISCARCLHFKECMRRGAPVSALARFIVWLDTKALQSIENELRQYCVKGLKLEAHAPDCNELEQGAFAVIRAYTEEGNRRILFRLNLNGDEDAEALRTLIFNAYIRGKRKNRKWN